MKERALKAPVAYPANLPLPLRSGYTITPTSASAPTLMQSGWTRVRRLEPHRYRTFNATFSLSTEEYKLWYDFLLTNKYHWIVMPLQTENSAGNTEPYLIDVVVRVTSGIQAQYTDWNTVVASLTFEEWLNPDGPVT